MYSLEYRWMRNPTPVTTSIITPLSGSTLKATSIGTVEVPPSIVNQRHAVQVNRVTACAPAPWPAAWAPPALVNMAKAARQSRNEPPTAESAIARTPSLPRRLPNTPHTNAPTSGSRSTSARREKSSEGN